MRVVFLLLVISFSSSFAFANNSDELAGAIITAFSNQDHVKLDQTSARIILEFNQLMDEIGIEKPADRALIGAGAFMVSGGLLVRSQSSILGVTGVGSLGPGVAFALANAATNADLSKDTELKSKIALGAMASVLLAIDSVGKNAPKNGTVLATAGIGLSTASFLGVPALINKMRENPKQEITPEEIEETPEFHLIADQHGKEFAHRFMSTSLREGAANSLVAYTSLSKDQAIKVITALQNLQADLQINYNLEKRRANNQKRGSLQRTSGFSSGQALKRKSVVHSEE